MPTLHTATQQLTEHIYDWRAANVEVDRRQRLIRNVALTGRDSKNGYRYSAHALRQAVPLYDNKPVFLDHAANLTRPHQRSTRDLAGSIVNPRFAGDRVRGDIQLLDTEAGRTFLALAESKSPAVGMSHVVLAQRGPDRSTVESIHDVVSVDAVVFPATSSTFSEAGRFPHPPLPGSLEDLLGDVDVQLPPHVQQLTGDPHAAVIRRALYAETIVLDVQTAHDERPAARAIAWSVADGRLTFGSELADFDAGNLREQHWLEAAQAAGDVQNRLDTSQTENKSLREQLARLESARQAAERQQHIDRLLSESNLPAAAITPLFRQQLHDAASDESRRTLIEERRHVLLAVQSPHSRSRAPAACAISDSQFIGAIKRKPPPFTRAA